MTNNHSFCMPRTWNNLTNSLILIICFVVIFILTPQTVQAAPWMGLPVITVTGTCDGAGNSVFTIINTGGAMTVDYTWRVYLNDTFFFSDSFSLNAAGNVNDRMQLSNNGLYGSIKVIIWDNNNTEVSSATSVCSVPPNLTLTPTMILTPTSKSTGAAASTDTNSPTAASSTAINPSGTQTITPAVAFTPIAAFTVMPGNTSAADWQNSPTSISAPPASTVMPGGAVTLNPFPSAASTSNIDVQASTAVARETASSMALNDREGGAGSTHLWPLLGYGAGIIAVSLLLIFIRRKRK
jgi:hypothetical protein